MVIIFKNDIGIPMLILTDVKKVELEHTTPFEERSTVFVDGLVEAKKFNQNVYDYRVYFNNNSKTPLIRDVSSLEVKV